MPGAAVLLLPAGTDNDLHHPKNDPATQNPQSFCSHANFQSQTCRQVCAALAYVLSGAKTGAMLWLVAYYFPSALFMTPFVAQFLLTTIGLYPSV